MAKTPLNGTKTHPLKPASIETLKRLAKGRIPGYQINPGIRDRLFRGGYAEQVQGGFWSTYWQITDAGRAALSAQEKTDGE